MMQAYSSPEVCSISDHCPGGPQSDAALVPVCRAAIAVLIGRTLWVTVVDKIVSPVQPLRITLEPMTPDTTV